MTGVILQTKLHIPSLRPAHIQRNQLIDKLNDRLQGENGRFSRKLTLVSAPPGFGKTTLISSWLHQLDQPATWLSLDAADNEPGRFIYYVIAALQQIENDLGDSALALLQSPQPPPIEALLTLLINDLANIPGQAILVLDDYHVIHDIAIHKALTYLLENQPPQLHLVIISRSDPVFPLHRLQGSGQMLGIYVRDLRFSETEVTSFLNETMGLSLSQNEMATLARRTEGWVAGLQLAALSMQNMPDPSEFVTLFAGDDRYISDYLIGEVFEHQPAYVQEFLLKSAILDRFCGPLCDAILGSGGQSLAGSEIAGKRSSQVIIQRLDQSNLFIINLDNRREWYRYHPLFADFLRLRLRDRPADEIGELHRRAATWYENNGLLAEAIDHALAGKAFQQASHMIEENALTTIFGHAQWATLFRWMEALPTDIIEGRPRLSLQYGWALFTTGRWDAAASLVQELRPTLEAQAQTAETKWLLGELATLAALVAYSHGDMKRCTEEARQALLLLPGDNLTLRCVAHLSLGESAMIQEDAPVARRSLQEAADTALAAGNKAIALFAIGDLARLEMAEGYLRRAAELYQQARLLGAIKENTVLGPTGIACIQMGEVLREWNELEEAESLVEEGLALCTQLTGLPNIVLEGQVNLARVLLAKGDSQRADEIMENSETLLAELLDKSSDPLPMLSATMAGRLRYWLTHGRLEAVAHWLATYSVNVDSAISPGNLAYHVLLARVLVEQKFLKRAQRQLRKLEKNEAARNLPRLTLEILILKALWLHAQDQPEQALKMLTQALRLSEAEGFIRLFTDYGEPIVPLLDQATRQESVSSKAKALLAIMAVRQPTVAEKSPETSHLLEPLKEQELRILRLMAAGRSNREIADELFLSVNTIKVYASRAYAKLGVHRRGEAVALAREYDLI